MESARACVPSISPMRHLIPIQTSERIRHTEGTNEEKRELMGCFKSKLKITKGIVTLSSAI